MKKLTMLLFIACVCVMLFPSMSALAAEDKPPNNVNITVVMPDVVTAPEPEEPEPTEPTPTLITMFPVDVTEIWDGGNWQIIKTYELNALESPLDIPQGSFERNGWKFTLTDILRKESANAETRAHTETVTLDTETNELEKILSMLSPTMEYTAEDGFVGILALDVTSIKVETAGTKTSSFAMSVTREYPHLSTNDTSLVPKTVTDRGKTYSLANVDWTAGNYVTVDYERIPEYYTAVATYTATGYSTKVTGYTTTAEYSGTLAKLSQGKTYCMAYYLGEEIRTPLEMVNLTPEPTPQPDPVEQPTEEPATDPIDEPMTEEPVADPIGEPVIEPEPETEAEPVDATQ